MPSVVTPIIVEWEDCDPAGIVFYPRFFSYFDRGCWNLWYAVGLTREAIRELGAVGFPIADAKAQFQYPCRFKDVLQLTSDVTEVEEGKWITVTHTIRIGERIAVSGYEKRFMGLPHPSDPERLRAGEIPASVLALLR